MSGVIPCSSAARDALEGWRRACAEDPQQLPAGVEPVQSRLVRSVGRADLAGEGAVYLKLMGFPRAKDRLRYSIRALPAVHEAGLLRRLAGAGVDCPEVIACWGGRRFGLPHMSLLVPRALPVDVGVVPGFAEMAEVAARLAKLGLFHHDLNRGNFVPLTGGGLAVIDLQSARWPGSDLGRERRLRMAAKLAAEAGPGADLLALATAGLCRDVDLTRVAQRAAAVERAELIRRIRRCLQSSSEFVVERRWNGRLCRRRASSAVPDQLLDRGRQCSAMWLGDRTLEVLDRRDAQLSALFKKCWWFPGQDSVYTPGLNGQVFPDEASTELLEGFRRYRRILGGDMDRSRPSPGVGRRRLVEDCE